MVTAPDVVARTDHGYRLGLPHEAVDALALRDAVYDAREAEGRHDLVRARDLARAALALPAPGGATDGPLGEIRSAAARHRAVATGVLGRALSGLGDRSRDGVAGVLRRVRGGLALAVQAGLAAGLAWFVAHDLVGRPAPFFAPIAAVITLASSVGQRLRRTAELVVGVAIGIGVGDAIILLIGSGPWQIGLIVLLAILVATALGLVRRHRRDFRRTVARWTGAYQYAIDQVLGDVIGRCRALDLRIAGTEEQAKRDFAVLLTVHVMNYLHSGGYEVAL